jgi:hypothetical protein
MGLTLAEGQKLDFLMKNREIQANPLCSEVMPVFISPKDGFVEHPSRT